MTGWEEDGAVVVATVVDVLSAEEDVVLCAVNENNKGDAIVRSHIE